MLFFDQGIRRDQAGEYKCIAENRHGKKEITTHFDVQCKYINIRCRIINKYIAYKIIR